jgi:hypothetical protein
VRALAVAGFAAVIGFAAEAKAGSLTTDLSTDNSGRQGMYFDLTAINSVEITSFDVNPNDAGNNWSVWYKVGTYAGNETNQAAWTEVFAGNDVSGALAITPVEITLGNTDGFYIFETNATQHYNDGISTYANANLSFTGGNGNYGFFDNTLANRVFSGTINYTDVPEPASLASAWCVAARPPEHRLSDNSTGGGARAVAAGIGRRFPDWTPRTTEPIATEMLETDDN